MAQKIGEALIRNGTLTRKQLSRALQTQLMLGGHLGTTLIELGFVDEETLGRMLGEIHGVRHAPAFALQNLPDWIVRALPAEVVRKRRVVPIGLEDRLLHLAVIDPKNLEGISTLTGCRIVPYVVPEVRVLEAMERYYGIPRRTRYVRLSYQLQVGTSFDRDRPAAPGAEPKRPAFGRAEQRPAESSGARAGTDAGRLAAVSRLMSRVESQRALGKAVLDFVARDAKRSILFGVDAESAFPYDWRGLEPEAGDDAGFPLTTDSVLSVVLEDLFFRGPVPDDPACHALYTTLGIEPPREMVVLPVYVHDHLEGIVYADGGPGGSLDLDTDLYVDFGERIGMALGILIQKARLCSG